MRPGLAGLGPARHGGARLLWRTRGASWVWTGTAWQGLVWSGSAVMVGLGPERLVGPGLDLAGLTWPGWDRSGWMGLGWVWLERGVADTSRLGLAGLGVDWLDGLGLVEVRQGLADRA